MSSLDYQSWETAFNKQCDAIIDYTDKVQEQAARDMLEEGIIPRTPIGKPETWQYPAHKGYTPGSAREGWGIEVDGPAIRIFNEVPYIDYLEKGWSKQAPAGMLRISLLEWQKWVQDAARKVRFV